MKITKTVDEWGIIRYMNENGEYHRENGPALIDGERKEWWINGKLHREDGPAYINGDYKAWRINGKRYTEEEFELELVKKKIGKDKRFIKVRSFKRVRKGIEEWVTLEGEYHREGGPAVIYSSGHKYWYINGKRHRDDGPAVERGNVSFAWYIDGKLHREDGPAIIDSEFSPDVPEETYALFGEMFETKEDWEEEVLKLKLSRIKGL